MPLIVPDQGERRMLEFVTGKVPAGDLRLRLFISPTDTPTESWDVGTPVEPSGDGYAAITLAAAGWTVATDGGTGTSTATHSQQTFNLTAAMDVQGYFVTDASGSHLMWVERFSGAPFTLPTGGGAIQVTPKLSAA